MKLSCLHTMVGDRPLPEAFAMIRDAGFDGIDLRGDIADDHLDQVRSLIEMTGVPVPTIYGRLTVPLLSPTIAERQQTMELIRSRLRTAAAVGADNVIVVPIFGDARIAVDLGDGIEAVETAVLFTLLAELEPAAGTAGVRLVLEPLNRKETHLLRSPSRTAELTRRFGSPWIRTMIDTYHTDLESQDPVAELTECGEQVVLMHLSDRDRGLPGSGGVDFGSLLAAAERTGYDGWMGLECRGPNGVEELAETVTWLRSAAATTPATRT